MVVSMFAGFPLLSVQIFLPIIAPVFLLLLSKISILRSEFVFKFLSLLVSLLSLAMSLYMGYLFDPQNPAMQFTEKKEWISSYNIYYSLGIDGLSIYFIILTTFLTVICILSSWSSTKERVREFMGLLLLLEGLVIGVFSATNTVLFYVFFEAVLVPMFLIIGIWGGENRVYAAFKFFIYTLFGSVPFLLGILYLLFVSETTEIIELHELVPLYHLSIQKWLWISFFLAFAIKVPMWPFHTWLPDAHVQAPTAGSVMLAGILLKLGGYGFLRFSVPMLPSASFYFADMVIILSIIAVIYTSFVALMQDDMKKMIAYSSVAHMGYATAGIFNLNVQGVEGSIFSMLSHGLISSALFLCIGFLYDRKHTKEILFYSGLASKMPVFAMLFMIFMLGSIGMPGISGFVGEFFVLFSSFGVSSIYGLLMATGMVLGAAYMLWLYARLIFGDMNSRVSDISDLNKREKIVLYPIVILVILFGISPNIVLNNISNFAKTFISQAEFFHSMEDGYQDDFGIEE